MNLKIIAGLRSLVQCSLENKRVSVTPRTMVEIRDVIQSTNNELCGLNYLTGPSIESFSLA